MWRTKIAESFVHPTLVNFTLQIISPLNSTFFYFLTVSTIQREGWVRLWPLHRSGFSAAWLKDSLPPIMQYFTSRQEILQNIINLTTAKQVIYHNTLFHIDTIPLWHKGTFINYHQGFIKSQWFQSLFRCRIEFLNFLMEFNIIAPYMGM